MNLHDILNHPSRNFLMTIGLWAGTLPVQASVVYEFKSAPFAVGWVQNLSQYEVKTTEGFLPGGTVNIGDPLTASLTFASPLAPNSTIQLSAESGGFDFMGRPNQGNVEAYSTQVSLYPITSDINAYLSGSAGTVSSYDRYSSLDGEVTTDATGNISEWNLNFTLYDDGSGGGFMLDHATNPPTIINGLPSSVDGLLSISSNPALPLTVSNVVSINDVPQDPPVSFDFNGADTAFVDPGLGQYRYYTEGPGSMVLVPEPESWAMIMAGLGLLGWKTRRLKK
ncbi:PEP-CTERM protein-sorting domain-containing protein [Nitrosospira briensis]|uniref:PEP-CTERM protein-sorting domain-containing protein n=1 Tax=Nitrosospira briensis TaxID=35799 RepID=A0A1I5AUY7_9PROT|nr:PEP-CTERM sorting domain-containing protein [Nitrosospira briensis]SFN66263.1 PEP-CTERM protein-sorting domain-containing protein [Nitrosospira briensis]